MRSGDDSSKKTPVSRAPQSAKSSGFKGTGDRDMGAALRKVYQHAIEEAIPPEMLDLLGKLE